MTNHNQQTILAVPFTTLFEKEILELLNHRLQNNLKTFIATPNPEMLLACVHNQIFQKILQSTNLNIPDGNGIIWAKIYLDSVKGNTSKIRIISKGILSIFAFLFHQKNQKKRFNKAIHGSDLMQEICQDTKLSQHKTFLLGNKQGLQSNVAELAYKKLKFKYKNLNLAGYYDGTPNDQDCLKNINHSQAEIVFVAFGAPKQETWIAENLKHLPTVKVIIGVGGSFDFIAEIIPRAPLWMRKIGLEWVYRLFKQPIKRIKRIYNAFIAFPILIIKTRLADQSKQTQ